MMVAHSSPVIQKAARMAFSSPEFEIYVFDDGQEVLNQLDKIDPHVILLGLSLPRRDGYEISRYLKAQEQFKKTALFLLQGVFEPMDRKKSAELEYDDIIQLPFDSQSLIHLVKTHVQRKNDPQTLPEEPTPGVFFDPEQEEELEARIKAVVKKESLEVERELEKRIKTQLLAEMESFIMAKLEDIKKKLKLNKEKKNVN